MPALLRRHPCHRRVSYADVHDRRGLRPLIHHPARWPRSLALQAVLVPLERLSRFRREQHQLLRQRVSRGGSMADREQVPPPW